MRLLSALKSFLAPTVRQPRPRRRVVFRPVLNRLAMETAGNIFATEWACVCGHYHGRVKVGENRIFFCPACDHLTEVRVAAVPSPFWKEAM